jgi:drug/metabolite transporter (DMT)-like permease
VTALAVLLSLAAAACFALSTVAQQRAVKVQQPHRVMDPRLLLRLLRQPLWLAGWLPDTAAVVLQALALRFGPLALVQPLLTSGLFLAIPLEAAVDRRRPHARDLTAVMVSALGLAAFLVAAQPTGGLSEPSAQGWLGVAVGSGVLVLACLALTPRSLGSTRGVVLGLATGVLYAVAAALLKAAAAKLSAGLLTLVTDWNVYALILVGLAGLLLHQNAVQCGRLAAPLTALTLADPVASVAIAVTAFHERLATDKPHLVVQVIAALLMAGGIWLAATRSPAAGR